jgi:hypothetical protein
MYQRLGTGAVRKLVHRRGQNGQTNQEESGKKTIGKRHHASIHNVPSSTSVQPYTGCGIA